MLCASMLAPWSKRISTTLMRPSWAAARSAVFKIYKKHNITFFLNKYYSRINNYFGIELSGRVIENYSSFALLQINTDINNLLNSIQVLSYNVPDKKCSAMIL